MGNVNRDGNPKEEPRGNARNQKHCDRNEESFYGLIGRLDTAEERISLGGGGRDRGKKNTISKDLDNYKNCDICIMGIPYTKVKEKRMKEISETIMT